FQQNAIMSSLSNSLLPVERRVLVKRRMFSLVAESSVSIVALNKELLERNCRCSRLSLSTIAL
ncbi:hypothetical protein, partial [Escherichia coli]|uniref:hypothetical protein n=1 Tax=Escherichia coli TaxID=562 RepID=UPI002898B943